MQFGPCFAATAVAEVEEWELAPIPEPSGVVYHPIRNSLFVVGDEGHIAEVSLSGELLKSKNIGGDLEAVTCDPASGLVYAAREGHETIFEIRPDDFKILRRFTIDRSYAGNANFLERGGDGIEGLTFKPEAGHAEGGRFFVVNQNDPPLLLEISIPIRSSKERFEIAEIVRVAKTGSGPLSGLLWDEDTNAFLVLSSLWRSVYIVDSELGYRRTVKVPGIMLEGIARLPDGSIVMAQDTGGLIRWTPPTNPFIIADEDEQEGRQEKRQGED